MRMKNLRDVSIGGYQCAREGAHKVPGVCGRMNSMPTASKNSRTGEGRVRNGKEGLCDVSDSPAWERTVDAPRKS